MGRILNSQSTFSLGVNEAGITLSDVTTDNVSVNMHGFCPKLPNNNQYYLNGVGSWVATSGISAGKLATPIYINGTSFDGSATIVNNFPEGFLINAKISVAVASNNITLTLVGNNGSALSATNIAYAMIGGTVRTINAPLSVTVNAGVNTFNSGSAELATKEIDYFPYLGYNATDGVTLGSSRIPYATCYGDFSATATNEKYCAISTITHATSTDYYNVIGRFAATLGASATYYWTVPAYTSINLIQRPIFETRWLTFTHSYTGFSANPVKTSMYKISYNEIKISSYYNSGGTSNSASYTESAPLTSAGYSVWKGNGADNSAGSDNTSYINSGSNIINFGKGSLSVNGFTTSGLKWTNYICFYQIA